MRRSEVRAKSKRGWGEEALSLDARLRLDRREVRYAKTMADSRFVNVGDPVPDITFPDLDGRLVALSEFAGRQLIVFMWASW